VKSDRNRATSNRATSNRATSNRATSNRATNNRVTNNRVTNNRVTNNEEGIDRPKKESGMKMEAGKGALSYEVDGSAQNPPVLLWHGAACTLRQWDPVVTRLADRFYLIRFDAPGQGQSSPLPDPDDYTFERYAAIANRLLDHLGVPSCHVWSMAWGSRAALAYCSLFPERVQSAALYDASIGTADTKAQAEGHKLAVARQAKAGIATFERPPGANEHAFPDAVAASLSAARKFDLPAAARTLQMPVLCATGDHDPNLESTRELVKVAQNARLEVMENVGHGSVLQRPDLACDLFTTFHEQLGTL